MKDRLSIRNAVRLLRALIFKNGPVYAHYGVTHRCNLHCQMCNIPQDLNEDEELSTGEVEKVFDLLRVLGVVYVSIGGGEPFLRGDLSLIVRMLIRKGFIVRLLSNGILADERLIKDLASAGLREVSLSLDTLDLKKQDYICGREGSWEEITGSIDLFSYNLPKSKMSLLINTTVSPLNIRELPELCSFAKRKDCYISFVPIENNGSSEFTFKKDDHRVIDESYGRLIEMKKEAGSSIFNSSLFLERSRQYLKSGRKNWQCDAGSLYVSISPKGRLSICHKCGPEIPLSETDPRAYFRSQEFKKARQDSIRSCTGCMRPCWAEMSFLLKDKRSLLEMARIRFS